MSNYWFISTRYRSSSKLALGAFLLAFVVILLGAYTRLTDAGLSCPDWPNCYGYLTAPHTDSQLADAAKNFPATPVNVKKAWTEMTHRYFAGVEGLLILCLAFSMFSRRYSKGPKASFIALILIGLLGVQVMLGMLTVTAKLKPVIVLAHLLTGVSILSVLWWAYLDLHLHDGLFFRQAPSALKRWLWTGLLIVFMQITLGGWVSTHYAGLACVDLPYCNGQLLPAIQWNNLNQDLIGIHMLHRIGAIITAIYIGLLGIILLAQKPLQTIGILLLLLIFAQFTLGILNVLWLRPVWIALAHHAIGITLLITVITALVKASFYMDNRYA